MQTAIAKWGNSLALRLPRHIVSDARLVEGSAVDVHIEDNRIIITPTRKKYRLSELLAQESENTRHEEAEWGPAKGGESW